MGISVKETLKNPIHGIFRDGHSCASLRPRHWGFLHGKKQKCDYFFSSFFNHL